MRCISCDGSGCPACGDLGVLRITDCPLLLIGREVWEFVEFAKLYEKGLPPVAGGALDQAKNFIDAVSFYFDEVKYWKNKKGPTWQHTE